MKTHTLSVESFVEKLQSIEQLILKKEPQQAALQLNELVRIAPRDPRIYLLGSLLAESTGHRDGCEQQARKAQELAPGWPVATIRLASVLLDNNKPEEAITTAREAVQEGTVQPGGQQPELLQRAADIAIKTHHYAQALEWLNSKLEFLPDSRSLQTEIAHLLEVTGKLDEAYEKYTDLLNATPDNIGLLISRLRVELVSGRKEEAAADAEKLLALDPDNEMAVFYSRIARGEQPETQPTGLITSLFDEYAVTFDQHLVRGLHYRLPKDVAEMILSWHPDRHLNVLDLGCGTGLLGVCLGRIDGALIGVDLSPKMVEQAAKHGVYDRFHLVNVLDALEATPANLYQIIAALDVLIYVGDLSTVAPNAERILTPGGRFIFSCEQGEEGGADFKVNTSTFRYTHQKKYLQTLLNKAGFSEINIEDRPIRNQAGEPVNGFLVVAHKSI